MNAPCAIFVAFSSSSAECLGALTTMFGVPILKLVRSFLHRGFIRLFSLRVKIEDHLYISL